MQICRIGRRWPGITFFRVTSFRLSFQTYHLFNKYMFRYVHSLDQIPDMVPFCPFLRRLLLHMELWYLTYKKTTINNQGDVARLSTVFLNMISCCDTLSHALLPSKCFRVLGIRVVYIFHSSSSYVWDGDPPRHQPRFGLTSASISRLPFGPVPSLDKTTALPLSKHVFFKGFFTSCTLWPTEPAPVDFSSSAAPKSPSTL